MSTQLPAAHPKVLSNLFESFDKAKLNKLLWELYRGWSYHSAEYADTAEVRDMLVFYEELKELLSGDEPIPPVDENNSLLRLLIATVRPKMIFQVIQHGVQSDYIDLVIVVSSRDPRPFSELEPIVELTTAESPRVSCMLYKDDFLNAAITSGYPYLWWVCTKENLVYSDGTGEVPQLEPAALRKLIDRATVEFTAGINRAKGFLKSSAESISAGNKSLAMFMIHQVAELSFRAIALSFFGIDRGNHSIKSLMKLNRKVAPQMNDVFLPGDEQSERLLKILDAAYIDSRYKIDYAVAADDLLSLMDCAKRIVEIAEWAFKERIGAFKS